MAVDFLEIFTGRMRPRHRRFHAAFNQLCAELGLNYLLRPVTHIRRVLMQGMTRWHGVRNLCLDGPNRAGLLHQALNRGSMPYLAEFDVPLALHGYHIQRHRRAYTEARRLLERPQLRALLTFSDWAGRSFGLHFGAEVEAKCRTVYPLAYEGARCGDFDRKTYDFAFISINFRTKSGPEAVRAFCEIRKQYPDARFCVVTRLAEARAQLGDLDHYPGVEWREATLNEAGIADLLAQTRCLVHPSLNDSFGVVVMEALAAGCAVIATDFASFGEMTGAANGWVLPAPTAAVVGETFITEFGNVGYHRAYLNTLSLHRFEAALAARMSEFLADDGQARRMMAASFDLFEARFSRHAWKQRMRAILREGFPELDISDD
jgi:glycosyltransferase involved in cell wall biosynthesis